MSRFELTFWNSATNYYTITEASNQSVVSRSLDWTENYPRKLTVVLSNATTVAASNLLSSSFAGWSATPGALEIGDNVNYFVYPDSAPTTKTEVFWGINTELSQTSDGLLTIIAHDYLKKYDHIQPRIVVFGNYRDGKIKDTTEYETTRTIDGITETGIVWPAVYVGVAVTDLRTTLSGTGSNLEPLMESVPVVDADDTREYWSCAQAFLARGDGLIGIQYEYQAIAISVDGHIQCAVQADVDGEPSGVDIAMSERLVGLGTHLTEPVQIDFTDAAHEAVPLEKGAKYWLVWTCDDTIRCTEDVGGSVNIIYHTAVPAYPYTDYYWWKLLPSGSWTAAGPDKNMSLELDFADYVEVAQEDYYYDASTIVVRKDGTPITTVDSYYDLYRGKVSYYYSTITTEEIFDRLIGFDSDVYADVDADCDTTYSLYQTRGKSVSECLRELADTYETAGAKSGYQHIVAAYLNGDGDNIVHVGFGPYSAGTTFARGDDIISVNLKRTTALRPASVMVIGKASDGSPIIVQRDDRALSTSFRTQSKMALLTTLTDESINTYAEANRKAWQMLDVYRRGTWEGAVTVTGVYPDLFNLDDTSESYGAGGHIDLTYAPLGISDDEFHVRGITLRENSTEIQLSNEDIFLKNMLTDARGRAERSESFIAPDDPFTHVFVSSYTGSVLTTATLYMQLETDLFDTAVTDCARMLCTKTTNTRYNTVTYHAEFEPRNGHTIDGSTEVMILALYAAETGGSSVASAVVNTSERPPKWRTTKVIAEVHCKAA
jgi:hypothetical protein